MSDKHPSFLFYSESFYFGTATMSFEDKGKYIHLLCAMHQKGRLSEDTITFLVGQVSPALRSKFKTDESGMWYNERLEKEIESRKGLIEPKKTKPKAEPKVSDTYKQVFNNCKSFYFSWYRKRFGISADFDGSDAKALKDIIKYLHIHEAGPENVLKNWTSLLDSFDKWDKFHQGQTRLRQINSNKSNIINLLKNGTGKTTGRIEPSAESMFNKLQKVNAANNVNSGTGGKDPGQ